MRLTQVLAKYRPEFIGYIPKFPGNVYKGKNRFVPPVTSFARYFMMRQVLREEKVAKFLQSPYISESEEHAYLKSIGRTRPEYLDDFLYKKVVSPPRQRYTSDLIERLDVSRSFESME